MPNNCSTLIHRKQNILQNTLRSNSDSKFQNDILETTAELCVAGTRKGSIYPLTSTPTTHQSSLFPNNRIEQSPNQLYDTHLPTIRYTKGNVDRQHQIPHELNFHSRSKLPSTNTSPKSNGYTPSGSMSSIFNALARQSTENLMNINKDFKGSTNPSPLPLSRRSQRLNKAIGINQNPTKQTIVPQKQSTDSGIDIRFSTSSGDTNQQHRILGISNRLRTNAPPVHIESPRIQETLTKERTTGQHYQRRANNAAKAPIKQKIDKYRRRSEEATQAINGGIYVNSANNGLSGTIPSSSLRPKPPPPSPTAASRRILSHAEIQARLDALHSSLNSNFNNSVEQPQKYSHQHPRHRVKSPYLYPTHQQLSPTMPTSNPQSPPVRFRRNHEPTHPISSANSSQHHLTNTKNNRRSQQQFSIKQSANSSQQNLYLAFIASRHLSTLEDTLLNYDPERKRSIRIFTWLQGVESHRHEQVDPEQLLALQKKPEDDQYDNLSLYSEIQYAVDDLPANTTGEPGERIVTMQFDDE